MVHEVRTIIFDAEEVILALMAYRRKNAGFLPAGKILAFESRDDIEASATVNASCAGITQPMKHAVSIGMLRDAFINFCVESNILLPRRGTKAVIFVDHHPALYVEMDTFIAGGFVAGEYEGEF